MPVDTSIVTIQDIKNSAKKSIVSKWQQRWDIYESGRFLHTFKPLVDSNLYLDLLSKDLFPTILQLRTGYCSLNEYRYKLNQCESSECVCGDIETVQHFILECPLYEDNRQKLQKNLSCNLTFLIWIWICSLVIMKMKIFLVGESLLYVNWDNTLPILVVFSAELLMGMHHNNLLTVSNTKSLKLHLWKFYL